MLRAVRIVAIAFGSLVAAYLAVALVAAILLGWGGKDAAAVGLLAFVLGGLVFADIMRRERRSPGSGGSERA